MNASIQFVKAAAVQLRRALEDAFRTDTALPGTRGERPSAGHCAAVAALVQKRLGGWLVSAVVYDESHWFNRIRAGKHLVDVDLTGDQFGREPIQIAGFGRLYTGTRVRRPAELRPETVARAQVLEKRARFGEALSRPGPRNGRRVRRVLPGASDGRKKLARTSTGYDASQDLRQKAKAAHGKPGAKKPWPEKLSLATGQKDRVSAKDHTSSQSSQS